jgi:radical SAM superfamily enzyme YgiQ (UPF0313 family)
MKLVFVNIMQELHRFDSTSYITQPPVPLAVLNGVTPKSIQTDLLDEQTDEVRFDGDVFAFTLSTQYARKVYRYADELRAAGKTVILGGIHPTVCPEEAMRHADAIVTGEAELLWPTVCDDLLGGRLQARYDGSPTPPSQMRPVDYRFFGRRSYLTPASLFATRGCNHRCSFCVSSRYMGPFRTKPLDVLEREIDQLQELYPHAFLQFTDDNLLANRKYASLVLELLGARRRRFVTMMTVDQFCDTALMEQMASAGCLGVAVGLESVDDHNCLAVRKFQNVGRSFPEAVRWANSLGIQVCGLIMLGLPHDTPERLAQTLRELEGVPCSLYDLRTLRLYPSTSLYQTMLSHGKVIPDWWLTEETEPGNRLLPGCLGVHYQHDHFTPMQLQHWALRFTIELSRMRPLAVANVVRIARRGRGLKFAGLLLAARHRGAKQARVLLAKLEEALASGKEPCEPKMAEEVSPLHSAGSGESPLPPPSDARQPALEIR